jgi:hypothetical protein
MELAFDTIVESLGYIRIYGYRFDLNENFGLRREGDGVRLLQKRVNLLLVCPICKDRRTTEEGVAKMFYKANWFERERTWVFDFNIQVTVTG